MTLSHRRPDTRGGTAIGTETALLDAAERVLVDRGLQATKVEDITGAAGVAKGTFYLYFSTKEDVIRAVQRRHFQIMLEKVAEASRQLADSDFWGVVDTLIETIVDYDLEHRDWYRQVVQGWAPPPSEFANERKVIHDLIAAAIRQGIDSGACHADDPEFTAVLLQSTIEGSLHHTCAIEEDPDRERLCREFKTFVRKVLAPRRDA